MASQQPTKVGGLVWCLRHIRTLICPEQCLKLSEGKKVHSPKYICLDYPNNGFRSSEHHPQITGLLSRNQDNYSISWRHKRYGIVSGYGKVKKSKKRAIYFAIYKDQDSNCSSSCLGDQNIKLCYHFTSFICDRTLF